MRNTDERALALESTWMRYAVVKREVERNIDAFFKTEELATALCRLGNLRNIEISLLRCPFEEGDEDLELIRDAWEIDVSYVLE